MLEQTGQIDRTDLRHISDGIERGRQSWTRTMTVETAGEKVRVVIKRDSYDFQSDIHVDVWSKATLSWNRVQSLSGSDHPDLPSYVTRDETEILMATNDLVVNMIAYAQEVLA